MEIDDEDTKECFEYDQQCIDVLNISYNPSNSMILLWNKFQIFVYENFNLKTITKVLIPEFQIHHLIITNNYLLCLDQTGNIHVTLLKFKNSSQKQLKCAFQPKEQCIKTFCSYNDDTVLSLKFEYDTFFLCINKINSNLELVKHVVVLSNCELNTTSLEKAYLTVFKCNKLQSEMLRKVFKVEIVSKELDLIIISLDGQSVYGCLFDSRMAEEVILVKLYSCPSEIKNMKVLNLEHLYLIIALDIGTVLKINLAEISAPPFITHLNTAIHKILIFNDKLIYTDAVSLWKMDIDNNFKELFIRNVNDLIICNNVIVCTTFNKLIYKLPFDNAIITKEEYCPAENVISNSECFSKIFEEIEKNKSLLKKINDEENYLMAMSLSNRQDVMDSIVECSFIVYESYNEVTHKNSEIMLTENVHEYFTNDIQILLVKLNISNEKQKIYDILSSLELNCHITVEEKNKIVKTTNIKLRTLLKKFNYVIPVRMVTTELCIHLKIVSIIPGSLNENKKIWSTIYRKNTILNSEHFIRTEKKLNVCLKETEDLDVLILKTCQNNMIQYGDIFNIHENNKTGKSKVMSFYVKLPTNYESIFNNKDLFAGLSESKTKCLLQQLNLEEFLKSKSHLTFSVNNEKVKIEISNDGFSLPVLKVVSDNFITAYQIRNFLANLIYKDYANYEAGKEFISSSFYTTTENIQKAIKDVITKSDFEEFYPLIEQFERNIIGELPL